MDVYLDLLCKPQDYSDLVFVTLLVSLLEKSSTSQMGHELANWAVGVCVQWMGQLASVLDRVKLNHSCLPLVESMNVHNAVPGFQATYWLVMSLGFPFSYCLTSVTLVVNGQTCWRYFKFIWLGEKEERQRMEMKDKQTAQLYRLCYP